MSVTGLKVATLLVVLGGGLVANPPPGELFGREISTAAWGALAGAALVGGMLSVALAGRALAYVAALAMPLPLLGPVHDFWTSGFFAIGVGAWAFALHLELMTFATRKRRWTALLHGERASLVAYERAYTRAFWALAAVTLVALAAVIGSFALLREVAPTTFAISIEARRVEGLFGMLVLLLALATALVLLLRRPRKAPAPAEPTAEVTP